MSTPEAVSEREEIEMLLPWYATGKLDAADQAKVEAYLAREPALRRQFALIEAEQTANVALNEAIAAPRTLTIERSMQAIAANTTLGARRAAGGLMDRVRGFFASPTARGVRYAAVAAAAVFVLQAVTIGALVSNPQGYTTASGGNAADGATAIVKFVDRASAQDIAATLAKLNMSVIDGPKPGGMFVVRLGARGLSQTERAARVVELRSAAGVVGLVLP